LDLKVEFWQRVLRVYRRIRDIANGRAFHHVSDREALNCLVLGAASRAVRAANELHVPSVAFVSSICSAFLWHGGCNRSLDIRKAVTLSLKLFSLHPAT